MSLRVSQVWRFPVKSMAGERLESVEISRSGVAGDRLVLVRDAAGRVVTSRTRPALLSHKGTLSPAGEPLVDGRPWDDRAVGADVERAAGPGARLVKAAVKQRFDVLPLLVATESALEAVGEDWRRFRPNLILAGTKELEERGWERMLLEIGTCRIVFGELRDRCVMTTFHPDTQEQDKRVLAKIGERFAGKLCLNAIAVSDGRVAVGDAASVQVLPPDLARELGLDGSW